MNCQPVPPAAAWDWAGLGLRVCPRGWGLGEGPAVFSGAPHQSSRVEGTGGFARPALQTSPTLQVVEVGLPRK